MRQLEPPYILSLQTQFETTPIARVFFRMVGVRFPTWQSASLISQEAGFMQKSAAEFMKEARGFYFDLALTGYSYP